MWYNQTIANTQNQLCRHVCGQNNAIRRTVAISENLVFAHIVTLGIFICYFYADSKTNHQKSPSQFGSRASSVPHWERGSTRIKRSFTVREWKGQHQRAASSSEGIEWKLILRDASWTNTFPAPRDDHLGRCPPVDVCTIRSQERGCAKRVIAREHLPCQFRDG